MTFDKLRQKHDIIQKLVDTINDNELSTLSKFMRSRILTPESYVTMLGETSSGKTTLINGLIKKKILKTSAAPTTGTVIEIKFDSQINTPEYYAINRNATMEALNQNTFDLLSTHPDNKLSRLQVTIPTNQSISGLRLFDTPGYGSIIDEHEEILKDFIPNSDIIIYVIGYKIGIQENDFLFMRYIQELIHEDTDVIVVVNRCPITLSNRDRRLDEIRQYTQDLFHRTVPIFTVLAETNPDDETLPPASDLWQYVNNILNSPERQNILTHTLNAYLNDLLTQADNIIKKREIAFLTSQEEKNDLRNYAEEFRQKGNNIINNVINPTFDRLFKRVPQFFSTAQNTIYDKLVAAIDKESNGRMEEMIAYVNNHLLPITIQREIKEYERELILELDAMNEQVDNYLNQATADYYHSVEIRLASNTELAARSGIGKIAGKIMENGLKQYFAAFGGAGGSGAGVANAAKHLLKKIGDFFGKKFSRETYNTLAHTLKKIGATSTKAVGCVVTAVLEIAMVIVEYTTWKSKLKKQIKKGLIDWASETKKTILSDLKTLKQKNIETLKEIIDENANAYEFEPDEEYDNIPDLITKKMQTHKELEEMNL